MVYQHVSTLTRFSSVGNSTVFVIIFVTADLGDGDLMETGVVDGITIATLNMDEPAKPVRRTRMNLLIHDY